jgi:predicted dehydrogenase
VSLRIGAVGLGRITAAHLPALEQLPDVDVVAGCDIDPGRTLMFRGSSRPVHTSVDDLLNHEPDVVVVATPTPTHAAVCHAILARTRAVRLLVEKPLGASPAEVDRLLAETRKGVQLDLIYHAAHAPEVAWARRRLDPAWGPVASVEASFADPYRDMDEARRASVYVSSWVDSGINALSVLAWFLTPIRIDSLTTTDPSGLTHEAKLGFESAGHHGTGLIRTSWDTDQASKHTTLTFASGTRLFLDHQGITGRLDQGDRRIDAFSYTGDNPRLVAHYLNAFQALLGDGDHFHAREHARLHRLLYQHM